MASIQLVCVFCFQIVLLTSKLVDAATPYAGTKLGIIKGLEEDAAPIFQSPIPMLYYSFKGIPFGKPPVDKLRWKHPEPYGNFTSVYEATNPAAPCMQTAGTTGQHPMSEDCLYLDIYVPHNVSGLYHNLTQAQQASGSSGQPQTGNNLHSVMVWIHGGSYTSGYAALYPAFKLVLEQNIIVVVIQYRLGALGFLSSGDEALPGNYGLWDQRLAMLWVKDNIRAFGGDSLQITVAGESAGSASASQHAISRQSAGIFRNVILMSGTASASWTSNKDPASTFRNFANLTGCGGLTTSAAKVACLQNKTVQVLQPAATQFAETNVAPFVPVVDGDFFTDTAENLLKNQTYLNSIEYNGYTFLNGVLNNEGAVVFLSLRAVLPGLGLTALASVAEEFFMSQALMTYFAGEIGQDVRDAANFQYFYPRDKASSTVPTVQILDAFADSLFVQPAISFASVTTQGMTSSTTPSSSGQSSPSSQSTTYMYLFDWYPNLTAGTPYEGMYHGLDVFYLFGLSDMAKHAYNIYELSGSFQPVDHKLSRAYGDIIGSFVRTGDPNNGIPANLTGTWRPYDIINEAYYRITDEPSIEQHMRAKQVSLWNDLLPRLHARWQQEHVTPSPSSTTPSPTTLSTTDKADAKKETFSKFSLTEIEAESVITALIVVCAILALLCILALAYICVLKRKTNGDKYSM